MRIRQETDAKKTAYRAKQRQKSRSKYCWAAPVFVFLSVSFSPLEATKDLISSDTPPRLQSTLLLSHSLKWEGKRKDEALITRELSAGLGKKLHLTYLLKDQKITGVIETETGSLISVKPHDLPRLLRQIKSPELFEAFCQNAYARSRFLSNGEVSFSLYQRGFGGGRLHDAAESGDLDNLNSLLADPNTSSQINTQNESGWAPLHCAAMRGDVEASRLLLDYGANIHQVGIRGMTPLHLSVQQNRPEVCRLLLERGASVEALNENGQTVLDLALASNTGRIIQLLREHAKSARMRIFEAEADEIDPLLQHSTDVRRKRKSCLASGAILGAACLVGGGVTVPVVILTRKKPPPQPSPSLSYSSSARPPSFSPSLPFSRSHSSSSSSSDSLSSSNSLSFSSSTSLSGSLASSHSPSISSSLSFSPSFSVSPSSPPPNCTAQLSFASLNGTNGFNLIGVSGSASGYSVSGAGDVNGDGVDDMIIGSVGTSYVVFGHKGTWPSIISLSSLNGTNGFSLTGVAGSESGWSVSNAGDVNGDEIDDVIIGAPFLNNYVGASYVVFGHNGVWPATIPLSGLNGQSGFNLTGVARSGSGWSVSRAGDVNNDGIDDMIIGAPFLDGGAGGVSYVVFGHTGNWPATIPLNSLNGANGFSLTGGGVETGYTVSGAGDINNDSIDDVIISAGIGISYVVFGHTGNWPATIPLNSLNGANGLSLTGAAGISVSGAGDINHDGIDDMIIGAPGANNGAGASYVIFGHGGSWPMTIPLNSLNGQNGFNLTGVVGSYSGSSVSRAGDINGDGIGDMIIGSPYTAGHAVVSDVVFGHTGIWPSTLSLSSLNGRNGFSLIGDISDIISSVISVSGIGDINGDGIDDVIAGAGYTNVYAGASYVVFGQHPCELASFTLEETSKTSKTTQKGMLSQLQRPGIFSKKTPHFSRDVDASPATSLQPMWTKPFSAAFRAMSSFPSFFSSEGSVEHLPTAPLQRNFNDYIKAFNLLKDSDVWLRESYWLQTHVKLGLVRGQLKTLSQNSRLSARRLREGRANFASAFEPSSLTLPTLEPLNSTYNLAVPLNISLPQPSSSLSLWG